MPTRRTMNVPPPTDWDEFEEMTRNALASKWQNPNLVRNGRPGQAQKGVDVFGQDGQDRHAGVQCKKYEQQISIWLIRTEVIKVEGFRPPIEAFYMATTTPQDAALQEAVRLLSEERIRQGKFPVGIFFRPDIYRELVMSPATFRSHYPALASDDLVTEMSRVVEEERQRREQYYDERFARIEQQIAAFSPTLPPNQANSTPAVLERVRHFAIILRL